MPVHYPSDQWRSWLAAAERSELTVAQFCRSIGVSVNTYYRWRQRLKDDPNTPAATEVGFIEVAMPISQVAIELPCGAIARVPNEKASLRPLVSVLLELEARQ